MVRYYSIHRPIGPGTFPKFPDNKVVEIKNFDSPVFVKSIGRTAWGFVEYEKEIEPKRAEDYELMCREEKENEE